MSGRREQAFMLFGLEPQERSWRGLWLVTAFFFATLFIAAVLSPFVYWAVQTWAEVAPNKLNTYLAGKDFPKYFDRLHWLSVALALPWLLKRCGLWSWEALGLPLKGYAWQPLLRWAALGVALFALAMGAHYFTGGMEWRRAWSVGKFLEAALWGFLGAVLVSMLEEAVFRGMILRVFYTALNPLLAILLSALFFAFIHFKKVPFQIGGSDSEVTLGSGFYVAFWSLLSITQTFVSVRFLNLFLVGFILALLFIKMRSLWPCIGLHGGWVWFSVVYGKFFNVDYEGAGTFWGSEIVIDGLFASLLLAPLAFWLMGRLYGSENQSQI